MATAKFTVCKSSCPSGMQALFHIGRSQQLLNAAVEVHELSGKIYRNSLHVALRSLDQAVLALQAAADREVSHV